MLNFKKSFPIRELTTFLVLLLSLFQFFSCANGDDAKTEPTLPQKTEEPARSHKTEIEEEVIPDGWVDISGYDSGIVEDIRYATDNNFVNEKLYECGRCFLRKPAAEALIKVQQKLQNKGYSLKLFDCYRPKPVQQLLWDKVPDARYVTPPDKGSMHNRGLAVDLTILDASGTELDMGTGYDHFGPEAYHGYKDFPNHVLDNRSLLRSIMNQYGFRHIKTEWWHYSLTGSKGDISDWQWDCD